MFDYIVGNPPYQMDDKGHKSSARPAYQIFVDRAKKLSPKILELIIPAKWYSGGKGLDNFRNEMLSDKRICRLIDYQDSRCVFPDIDLAGGLCIFAWNREYLGNCTYTSIYNSNKITISRELSEYDTFVRLPTALDILRKVQSFSEPTLDRIISPRKPFGLDTKVRPTPDGDILLRYSGGLTGPFRKDLITKGSEYIDKYEVMISYLTSEHAGQPDKHGRFRVLSTMQILPPGTVCTETYLIAGCYDTETQSINLLNYLRTKFVRFLILQKSISQHIKRDYFSWVPLKDFSYSYEDKDLYAKYNLSEHEIDFIENTIKEIPC